MRMSSIEQVRVVVFLAEPQHMEVVWHRSAGEEFNTDLRSQIHIRFIHLGRTSLVSWTV
jgi:hypothetical protein